MTTHGTPAFPTEFGPEYGVEFFAKGGLYRVERRNETTWVVSQVSGEKVNFELVLTGTWPVFSGEGRDGVSRLSFDKMSVESIFARIF